MLIQLQIVQNFKYQFIPSIIVTIDSKKYVFNVFDGFQRFRNEQSYGLQKPANYFFTQLQAENLAGFFCQSINLFGSSAFGSKIYGPKNIATYLEQVRNSIIVGQYLMPFSAHEFYTKKTMYGINSKQVYEKLSKQRKQENMEIEQNQQQQNQQDCSYVKNAKISALHNKNKRSSEFLINNLKKNEINDASVNIKNSEFQDNMVKIIPIFIYNPVDSEKSGQILSYIMVTNKMKPKFNKEKLKECIKDKTLQGELFKNGQVEIDGKVYKKEDFQENSGPSPVLIVIDIPDKQYLDALISNFDLQKFFQKNIDSKEHFVSTIVHVTPLQILQNDEYANYCHNFGDNVTHVFCDQDLTDNQMDEKMIQVQETQFKFHGYIQQLKEKFPNFYPDFKFQTPQTIYEKNSKTPLQDLNHINQLEKIFTSRKFSHLKAWPVEETYNRETFYRQYQGFQNHQFPEFKFSPEFDELYKKYQNKYTTQNKKQDNLELKQFSYPYVAFLGTASMMPASYRNVSSILLQGERCNIIMDCGEGSFGQFYERFQFSQEQQEGQTFLKELIKLKYIIISHHHEDHFMGVLNFLKYRQNYIQKHKIQNTEDNQVFLTVSLNILPFLTLYMQFIEKLNVKMIATHQIQNSTDNIPLQLIEQEFKTQGNLVQDYKQIQLQFQDNYKLFKQQCEKDQVSFSLCDVDHCQQSVGIKVQFQGDNEKIITYSGDTRPCETFVNLSKNADLMIHEATYSSDLQESAAAHMHSTVQEAIDSAIKSQSKFLALTHFSQRYSKKANIENFENQVYQQYFENNTIYAYDHLGFGFSQLSEAAQISQCCLRINFDESQ